MRMPGSLLCVAVGTLLLSPALDATPPASAKTSPPGAALVCVKDLKGFTRSSQEHAISIQSTSFASEMQAAPAGESIPAPAVPQVGATCVEQPGMVFVIGGLGGGDSLATHARRVFDCCCVPHEICPFHWCHGKRHHFQDLFDQCNVTCQSDELAAQIMAFRQQHPTRPIYIMAWSAGVGVALGAAERLPPDSLERVIVMCAACSKGYNLCGALRATRCGVVSFHSPMDHFYLNAVLRCLGTIDRVHGQGAGVYGFCMPCCLSCEEQELYHRRLIQVPWRPHMILDGHPGGHLWYKSDRFLSAHVVPWLRTCCVEGITVSGTAETLPGPAAASSTAATPIIAPPPATPAVSDTAAPANPLAEIAVPARLAGQPSPQ